MSNLPKTDNNILDSPEAKEYTIKYRLKYWALIIFSVFMFICIVYCGYQAYLKDKDIYPLFVPFLIVGRALLEAITMEPEYKTQKPIE